MKAIQLPLARERGTSLVEVLIALVVLSVGLLGLAGMQITGVQTGQSALYRSIATLMASDIADRMRANPIGVRDGAYDNINSVPGDPGCITSGCSAAQMAAYDAHAWGTSLEQALPGGRGIVQAIGGGQFQVSVMWDDERRGVTGIGCDPNNSGDLKCFRVTFEP